MYALVNTDKNQVEHVVNTRPESLIAGYALYKVPKVFEDALAASAEVETLVIQPRKPEDAEGEGDNASDTVELNNAASYSAKKTTYDFDPTDMIALAGVDFEAFLSDYENAGIEPLLKESTADRELNLLTVDVITLDFNAIASTYRRIARNLNAVIAGLLESDRADALDLIGDLLILYPLPFTIVDGQVTTNV